MASNPFIGDNFFKENPAKVLGVQTTKKGRFDNDMIVVEGGIDQINKIDAAPIAVVDLYPDQVLTTKNKQELINEVFSGEADEVLKKKVKKLRTGKDSVKEAPSTRHTQQVYSTREIGELYNKQITFEELQAYYYTNPRLNHKLLFDEYTLSRQDLIDKDLICIDETEKKFVYAYTYKSGNISKKISLLKF